jgi:glycosyltransferase involved in cell wall biosynthesis
LEIENKKTVLLIKSNLMSEETKRPKIARLLPSYKTIAISWDRGSRASIISQSSRLNTFMEIKFAFRAPFGIKSIFFLPIWWLYIFRKLISMEWDIAHVINFDSIIPTIIVGKLRNKPVIYEILDVYIDQIFLPSWVRSIVLKIDKLFISLADAIIIADESQIEELSGIPNSKIVPIYDSPQDMLVTKEYGRKHQIFVIFFAGVLDAARRLNLDKLVSAIKDINDVKLIIAGYGDLTEEIEKWSHEMPDKVEFIGSISHEEVINHSKNADLLFVLRDPIVPVNRYICGSKLLEAMACGKPILVNKGTSTANKVLEENCGLVVDANNIKEIMGAIVMLRDNPELCKELGANGRRAYEGRYSWEIMEQRLITLYQELIGLRRR